MKRKLTVMQRQAILKWFCIFISVAMLVGVFMAVPYIARAIPKVSTNDSRDFLDGTPAMGWVGAEGPEPVCWLKDGVYVSTELERYIDLSAFLDKNKPTAGYAALGAVGADEQGLWDAGLEDQYYKDLHSGNYEILSFVDDFKIEIYRTHIIIHFTGENL